MVRNKRAAPAAPAPTTTTLSPPLIQTQPWSSERRKARAPPPPQTAETTTTTMTEVSVTRTPVQKAGGVLPSPAGQAAARFCLGPYERRGGGAAQDTTDGGSLGVESEGSSTDVGVYLEDSASDVSQESLVTSDSAVSSPTAGRVGRLSPGADSVAGVATTPAGTQDNTGNKTSRGSQFVDAGEQKIWPVSTKSTQLSNEAEIKNANLEVVKEATLKQNKVIHKDPQPSKSVCVVKLNSSEISTHNVTATDTKGHAAATDKVVEPKTSSPEMVKDNQNISKADLLSPAPMQSSSAKKLLPSPIKSRSVAHGFSTVFLSPEQQPTGPLSSTAEKPISPSQESSPLPAASHASPASASSQGSTSTVFLSPSQPESPQSVSEAVPHDKHQQPSPKATAPQPSEVQQNQQTPRKSKAPQPPPKTPVRQTKPSLISPPTTLESSPPPPSPRPPAAAASLRQLQSPAPAPPPPPAVQTRPYTERQRSPHSAPPPALPEHGFQFHLREGAPEGEQGVTADGFAGLRDYLAPTAPIHSSRGTVRGVKDRVRAGIATFLQDNSTAKALKSREQGRLVLYVTSMSIVRPTYQRCQRVRQILRQLMAQFEERDLFLSEDHQRELQRRLGADRVIPPQVFIDGNLLGGAEAVERLNESGELRRMLRPFKMSGPHSSCGKCGGFRMLPCTSCNGSKKSCHRNHFTEQWVVLRCGACDQSGLMRCDLCHS